VCDVCVCDLWSTELLNWEKLWVIFKYTKGFGVKFSLQLLFNEKMSLKFSWFGLSEM